MAKDETIDGLPNKGGQAKPLLDIDGVGDPDPVIDDDDGAGDDQGGNDDDQKPGTKTISEDQYNLMVEKSGVVDLIEGNPALAQYVASSLRNGIGDQGDDVNDDNDDDFSSVDLQNHPYIKQLEQRLSRAEAAGSTAAAAARIMSFGRDHADLSDYEKEITGLVKDYGMPLEKAYEIARALAGKATSNGTAPKTRTGAAAEGKGRVSITDASGEDGDIIAAARAKINDPTRRVSIGDAMEIANEAATLLHSSEET